MPDEPVPVPAMPTPARRPLERFWPYVELPEQLTDEEIAKLDPDLHAELKAYTDRRRIELGD